MRNNNTVLCAFLSYFFSQSIEAAVRFMLRVQDSKLREFTIVDRG